MTEKVRVASQLPPLKLGAIAGFASGTTGVALFLVPTTMLLLFYFTEVAGIAAAAAGTIFLLMRAVDALIDIPIGLLVDRVRPGRLGKFRRWLIAMAVPILLITVALFMIPQLSPVGVLIWAYVAYGLFGIAYSFIDIPLGSLAAVMTQQPTERTKLGSARALSNIVVGTLIGAVVLPMLTPDRDLRAMFAIIVLILGVVGAILIVIAGLVTRERVERTTEAVTVRQGLRVLRTNRPLLIVSLAAFLMFTGTAASTGTTAYYMRDVLNALPYAGISAMIGLVISAGAALLAPLVVRRFGKPRVFIAGAAIAIAGNVLVMFAPGVVLGFTGIALGGIGIGLNLVLVFSMQADAVEYGEWRTGVRAEAVSFSTFAFITKWASSIGGAVGAYALAIGGYVAGAAVQSSSAEWGIRIAFGGLPVVCMTLALIIMLAYPLSDKRFLQILTELRTRRESAKAVEGEPIDEGRAGR